MHLSLAVPLLLGAAVSAAPLLESRALVSGAGYPYDWPEFRAAHKNTKVDRGDGDVNFWDFSAYKSYGTENFGCHAVCGILAEMSGLYPTCDEPWMPVFASYCFGKEQGQCQGKIRYPRAVKGNKACQGKPWPQSSASSPSDASAPKAPAEAEKAPAEAEKAPVEKPSSPGGPGGPGAQTDNSVPVPAKVTPNVVPESTPSRSYFPSAAPSGTVSGKVANTTSTSIVPMTAGAAGTSFSAFAAITVAIFVVVVVS
ncbi:hypothetical protein NOR_05200 [Metarhizium rileyi]|uniref:Uncharacterized protein n=1 Tax=Metarhizium rileyi (strain RCEF 4871) TaxID=1649241 RepID=A0A167CXF9_METRR|nr:hypothetical protein NOR_05200 [Metarhizium rileyi RCEF 4871]